MVTTPTPPPHWNFWEHAADDAPVPNEPAVPVQPPQPVPVGTIAPGVIWDEANSWTFEKVKEYYEQLGAAPMKKKSLNNGIVLTHSNFTKGGKALAAALDAARVVKHDLGPILKTDPTLYTITKDAWGVASKYEYIKGASVPFIINWGCANPPRGAVFKDLPVNIFKKVINDPKAVSSATNKSSFFALMSKSSDPPRIPEFTNDLDVAQKWVDDGLTVIGRMNHGSSGKDVAFYNEAPDKFLGSDLWVQYKKKKHEYRLHFMNGGIFLIQQKVLPKTDPDGQPIPKDNVDFRIRTHRTGFIFQKFDVRVPEDVATQALKAAKASGLDFGAIDVIYNAHEDKAYVLEINTAPGLEGTTVDTYKAEFQKLLAA
jgi:hypothetical protein